MSDGVLKIVADARERGECPDLREANLRWANLREADLREADLREANLRWANLREADLREADLREANLRGANLREADLREANLCEANLCGANLCGANLSEADLREANLRGANLREANLRGANLSEADLREANLRGANLCEANLRWANLREADLREATNIPDYVCAVTNILPEGAIIGWKKLRDDFICKLEIPADARRSNATGRKCRCDKALVLEIWDGNNQVETGVSKHDDKFTYRAGEMVSVPDFDEDRWNECSTGIHFFITRFEAEEW